MVQTKRMNSKFYILILVIVSFLTSLTGGWTMELSSQEFEDGRFIPVKFTCQGQDINPALIIENIPKEAKSLALVVDDPDAPGETWIHWVVFDIPVIKQIEENSIPGKQGVNSQAMQSYQGPCPPAGVHRYFFKLYALDAVLNLKAGISKTQLEQAMQGHILDKAQLVGLYKKKS